VIARMIVAQREGRALPAPESAAEELALVSATPPRWVAELAAALVARDRVDEGRALATALGAVCGARALDALREVERSADVDVARGAHRLRARLAIAVGPPITVELLGPTQLSRDGRPVDHEHLRRRRVRELLACVAHHESTTRDKVLGALWPDLSDAAARRNLRVTLTYLQSVLEPDRLRDEPPFYSRSTKSGSGWPARPTCRSTSASSRLWRDADAATATGDLDAATDEYERALRLWRGDYLEEFRDSEWAGVASDHARAIAVGAFVRAGNVALGAGRTDAALAAAQRTLAVEPWSEDSYRVLIAALLAAGDRAGAARALEQCDAMLAELGVEAAPATDMLRRSFSGAGR
jgi:DNA-binding SARP family transcriptional activator